MEHEINTKETREFQSETKQLLDLMINSIYTNKEIFLRELISNASDAIDKIKFASLTNNTLLQNNDEFEIFIVPDDINKTLTVSDNGMGMTYNEVIENIGTIAKSGTKSFLEKLKEKEININSELIGQFGVGFYSVFMVVDKVTLITRAPGETGVKWESTGSGNYTIEKYNKKSRGTTIILHLKEEFYSTKQSDENFLNLQTIQNLVKKYSDFIRYPIKMNCIKEEPQCDNNNETSNSPSVSKIFEIKILNSMSPLWIKNKNEITKEEYENLYQNLFHAWDKPIDIIHYKAEGTLEFTALLFIPSHAPHNLYDRESSFGLQLYSKHVYIMSNCQNLLPEYLRFVKGLVDSPDFSLNISREILQHSKQLKQIGKNLEKIIFKNLENLLYKNRKDYEKFWNEFGKVIKAGIYTDSQNRDKLKLLLLFDSSYSSTELTTLEEYTKRKTDNQKVIYYATGKDRSIIERLPQMELLREKKIEVLYLLDSVDEFAIDSLQNYNDLKFQSVSRGDLNLNEINISEEKKDIEMITNENKDLINAIKNQLKDKIYDIKISSRLKSSAVCLVSSDNGVSLSMEQILTGINNTTFKANRILEINPEHEVFTVIKDLYNTFPSSEIFKDYCDLLYTQALLIEGMLPEDPISFANKIANLMTIKCKKDSLTD